MTAAQNADLSAMRISDAAGLRYGDEVFEYLVLDERGIGFRSSGLAAWPGPSRRALTDLRE
jgi:hypothetical protein